MWITRYQEGESSLLKERSMTQILEKGTDHAQAKPQNSQLCSEATLLENKTEH